ncbi:hypothetical protein ABPG74_022586 [Tetrahymena malaccensis]
MKMNTENINNSVLDQKYPNFNSNHMLEVQIGNKNEEEDFYSLNMRKQDTIMISASLVTEGKDLNMTKVDSTQDQIKLTDQQRNRLGSVQSKVEQIQQNKRMTTERDQRFSSVSKAILGFQRRKCQEQQQNQEQNINVEVSYQQNIEVVPVKLMKAINLLVNVKSFYRQLSKNQRIWGKLTDQQHNVIGDITSFKKLDQDYAYFTLKIIQITQKIANVFRLQKNSVLIQIPLFSPQSLWKRTWDLFQAFLIISTSFLLSLKNFFFLEISPYQIYFNITSFAFIIDMVFSFNTALIEKGNLNIDRKQISLHYLKGNFALDCIGIIPIFLQQFDNQSQFDTLYWILDLLIIFKFFLLSKIIENIAFYLNYEKNSKNSVDLVKLLFMIGCVCHFFCILWHGLGVYEVKIGIEDNWLAAQNLVNEQNVLKRYVYSFYFLAVTMITVGYGDITPKNQYEMCFTILTMFTTGFIYAFCLNKIGSILENIEKKDKQYKESMQILHGFMREENVSTILRAKISNYLEYLYKESNEVQKQQEKSIIDILSNQLKSDLIKDVQGKYVSNLPILSKLNSLQEIIYIMEECLYSPGEFIFRQKDIDDSALYLLVKGHVNIVIETQNRESPNTILRTIEKQQYFGEISFFTGFCRTASAVASDFCRVYKIKREKFLQVIKKDEQDFENFQMTVETLTQKNNFKFLNIKCYLCGQGDHYSINCPKTHLTFSKQVIVSLNNKSEPHVQRTNIDRRTFDKTNALQLVQRCINGVYEINNNQKYFDILDELESGLKLDEWYDDSESEEDFISQEINQNVKLKDEFKPNSKFNALSEIYQKESEQFNDKFYQQSTDISNQIIQLEQKDQNNRSRLSIFNLNNNNCPPQAINKYRSSIVDQIQNNNIPKFESNLLQSVSEQNQSSQFSSSSNSSSSSRSKSSDSSSANSQKSQSQISSEQISQNSQFLKKKPTQQSKNKTQSSKQNKTNSSIDTNSKKVVKKLAENENLSPKLPKYKKEKTNQKEGSLIFQDEDIQKDQKNFTQTKYKIQKDLSFSQNDEFFFNPKDEYGHQNSSQKVQFTTVDNKQLSRNNDNSEDFEKKHKNLISLRSQSKGKYYSKENSQYYDLEGKQKMDSSPNIEVITKNNPIRLIKAINLLVNVKSFYRLLTKNTRILGKLTSKQHYLINDATSVYYILMESKNQSFLYHFPKIKQFIQRIKLVTRNLNFCIPMFQPYNLSKFMWDILQAILILSVMFLFSLVTFFQMATLEFTRFFQIVFILFVIDMLFTFNTAILEKGEVIFDRKKAALTYLKRNFIMDQIALLPLIMFFFDIKIQGLYSWAIYFQILMKLYVLQDIFDRLTYFLNYQKNMKNIVDIVKLIFIIGCVCHVFCLFWHGIAVYEIKQGSKNTWLQVRGIQDDDVFTRYVQSFYYLAVTMITVGYGDITPQTTYEIIFSTVTMFVTGFFYAFSLNKIGIIIDNLEMKDKSYKQSMQIIHRLMRQEKVSQSLRVQISNYLQYLYKESDEIAKQQENDIINKLSKKLKSDLIQEVQGKYLKDIEFIDKLKTKFKIVESMEECLFSPGEYIFRQGEIDDCALYYIVKGSVHITYEYQEGNQTRNLILAELKKSQYFGEMQFIQEENLSQLQKLEDELHLSQDEAFIEEYLQELQDLEKAQELQNQQSSLIKEETFDANSQKIKEEEEQEEECDSNDNNNDADVDNDQDKNQNISLSEQNKVIIQVQNQMNNSRNQSSNYSNKISSSIGEIKNQPEKQLQLQRNQSIKISKKSENNSELLNQQISVTSSKNSIKSQLQIVYGDQRSSSLYNSKLSQKLQRTNSLSQTDQMNEIKSKIQNVSSPKNINLKHENEIELKSNSFDQRVNYEKSSSFQKSQDNCHNFQKQASHQAGYSDNQNHQLLKQSSLQKFLQRKSFSLTNFQENAVQQQKHTNHSQFKNQTNKNQKQDNLIDENEKPQYTNQIDNPDYSIENSQNKKQNVQIKVRKSKSFDESFQQQIKVQLELTPKQNSQNAYNQTKLFQKLENLNNHQQNQYQKTNTLSIQSKNISKQTSLNNSYLGSLTSFNSYKSDQKFQNEKIFEIHQNQLNSISNRRKSKKITLLRQLMNQKRQSLILSPAMQLQIINQIQNQQIKNQNNDSNQSDQNAQMQNRYKYENTLNQLPRNSGTFFQANQNRNSIYYAQSQHSQCFMPPLFQPQSNSERRSHILNKNLNKSPLQDYNRSRLSNPQLQGNLDLNNKLVETLTEINMRENTKKTQIPSQMQLQIDNNLLQLTGQNEKDQIYLDQQGDSSYLMLQLFEKFKVYKYYYPNYNIGVVIQSIKQNFELQNKLKQSTRPKQSSRNTLLSKKMNKFNEKMYNFKKTKDMSFKNIL